MSSVASVTIRIYHVSSGFIDVVFFYSYFRFLNAAMYGNSLYNDRLSFTSSISRCPIPLNTPSHPFDVLPRFQKICTNPWKLFITFDDRESNVAALEYLHSYFKMAVSFCLHPFGPVPVRQQIAQCAIVHHLQYSKV